MDEIYWQDLMQKLKNYLNNTFPAYDTKVARDKEKGYVQLFVTGEIAHKNLVQMLMCKDAFIAGYIAAVQ